jgi:hypothetical protein
MPYREPDPDDPNVLVGVDLPADAEAVRDMAWVFAEEFARLGHDAPQILRVFRAPFYAGAHRALRELGEAEVSAIVAECVDVWGTARRAVARADRAAAPRAAGPAAPAAEGG